jgi:anthranilate synthase/indole-3-glycerol phosphate synthase/phosphoribosylanthranilate isomerase
MDLVPETTIVCALSGISGPADVEAYKKDGVKAILVGEALMRAKNTESFVSELLGGNTASKSSKSLPPLVKICGTRTPEAARAAVEAGADLIGIIQVEGRKRRVTDEVAWQISEVVKTTPRPSSTQTLDTDASIYFEHSANLLRHPTRALLVGVFAGQPLSYIIEQQRKLGLDVVQLHGDEPVEWASLIPVPVIRKFSPGEPSLARQAYHALPLLDSGAGGSGELLDLSSVIKDLESNDGLRTILAGGLNPENVAEVIKSLGKSASKVVGVDVSSGVETNGTQDLEKIRTFVAAAKGH